MIEWLRIWNETVVDDFQTLSHDSSVGIATDYGLNGVLGFDSRQGLWSFLFTTLSRTALGPTQPPIQWVPGALSLVINRPGHEAGRSPQPSSEKRMRGATPPLLQYVFMAWYLVTHRDKFTFTNILEGLRKAMKHLSQCSRFPCRDLNPGFSRYETKHSTVNSTEQMMMMMMMITK
jgi:hypothetical protein